MAFRVAPALSDLFGSETRAKVLGFLADSREPQTGYSLSKAIDVTPSKVYPELRDLAEAGFLRSVDRGPNRRAYVLVDEDLQRLLVKRVRITTTEEWFSPARIDERRRAFEATARVPVVLPPLRARPRAIPNRREFERSPEKDRAVARVRRGLRAQDSGPSR